MSKMFHCLFMVLWSHIMVISIDAIQYSRTSVAMVHVVLLVWSIAMAVLQFYVLIKEIREE